MDTNEMVKQPYMQNRELSWLDFNKRVLRSGRRLPPCRCWSGLNFISIFWSNLQEFFMVRVGSAHRPGPHQEDHHRFEVRHDALSSSLTPSTRNATSCTPTTSKPIENGAQRCWGEEGIRDSRKEELTEEQLRPPAIGYMAHQCAALPFAADHQYAPPLPASGERRLCTSCVRLDDEPRSKA